MIIVLLMFGLGLFFVIKGGDWFVDAAVWIAHVSGIPQIIIGSTLVSLATTLPELVVSLYASAQNHPEVAVGNAIGSTICNLGLILALCITFRNFQIKSSIFLVKAFVMLGAGFLVWYFFFDGMISTQEGIILLILLGVYILINFLDVKANNHSYKPDKIVKKHIIRKIAKFIIGSGMVVIGARFLVESGVSIAYYLRIPEMIISLTFIAIGTSLPELVTSITAAVKGHNEMTLGNIIGANILNLLFVLGAAATINPLTAPPQVRIFDLPVSLFLMTVIIIAGSTDRKVSRWEGIFMLLIYFGYIATLGFVFLN